MIIVKDIINEFNLNDVYTLTTILTIVIFYYKIIFAATVKVSILMLTTRVALNIGKETCSKNIGNMSKSVIYVSRKYR